MQLHTIKATLTRRKLGGVVKSACFVARIRFARECWKRRRAVAHLGEGAAYNFTMASHLALLHPFRSC